MAVEKISIDIKSNLAEITQQLSNLDSDIKKLKNAKPNLQVNAEKLTNAKAEISKVNVELKRLQSEKALIKADASQADTAKAKIKELNDQMNALKARKAVLQVTTEQLKGSDTELKKLEKQMTSLNNKKARLQVEKSDLEQTGTSVNSLKSKLSELGSKTTKINISSNIAEMGSKLDGIGSKLLSIFDPLTSRLGQYVGMGAVFSVVDKGINTLTESVGGAIKRFDTLNNSTRSFMNMGIEKSTVDTEMENLKTSVQGLPTAMDDAISNVQLLVGSTQDMGKSVKIFRAMNDGIIGFGGTTDMVTNGVVQLSQAFSNGKIDAATWNSMINSGLGPSLNAIAKTMNKTTGELKNELSEGTISVEQFQDALISLDENGGGGMASLQNIVKDATSGIATGIENAKTAVTRGTTNIIESIDNILKNAGLDGIGGVIGKMGASVESNLTKLSTFIADNQDKIVGFFNSAKEIAAGFNGSEFLSGMISGFSTLKDVLIQVGTYGKPILTFVGDLITRFGDGSLSAGLGKLIPVLIGAGIGFKALGFGMKILSGPMKLLEKFKLPSFFGSKDKGGLATTLEAFKGNMFDGVTKFAKSAGKLALVSGVIKLIEEAAQALQDVNNKVSGDFSQIVPKLANMALAIGGMSVFVKIVGDFAAKDPKAAIAGLASLALISVELMLAAETMAQINEKVPENIGNFASKLANMAQAIGGMSLFVGVAGKLAEKNPVAAIAGLASIAAISLELMLAAEAMSQINKKVPDNIASFASKMANMGIAITGMGILVAAVGGLMATGIGALVGAAGLLGVAAIAGELMLVAEAIQQVNDKVPDDFSSVKGKIDTIADTIQHFTDSNLGNLLDVFSNAVGVVNTEVVIEGINKFVDLADSLNRLAEVEIPEGVKSKLTQLQTILQAMDGATFEELLSHIVQTVDLIVIDESLNQLLDISRKFSRLGKIKVNVEDVKQKVKDIQDVIGVLGGGEGIFSKLKNLVSGAIDTGQFAVADEAFGQLLDIGRKLEQLKRVKFDVDKVATIVDNIQAVVEKLSDGSITKLIGTMIKQAELTEVKDALTALYALYEPINSLAKENVMPVIAGQKIKLLNQLIKDLGTANLIDYFGTMLKGAQLTEVKDALVAMNSLVEPINELAKGTVNTGMANGKIQLIETVIEKLGTADLLEYFGTMLKEAQLKEVHDALAAMQNLVEPINTLSKETVNSGIANNTIHLVGTVIEKLGTADLLQYFGSMLKSAQLTEILEAFNGLFSLIEPINRIAKESINSGDARKKIDLINSVVEEVFSGALKEWMDSTKDISGLDSILTVIEQLQAIQTSINQFGNEETDITSIKSVITALDALSEQLAGLENLEKSTEKVTQLTALANTLVEFGNVTLNMENIRVNISNVKEVINELNSFPPANGPQSILSLVTAFNELVVQLTNLSPQFDSIGLDYGGGIINGFNHAKVPTTILAVVDNLIKSLQAKKSKFSDIGKSYGTALKNAFSEAVKNLGTVIDSEVSMLNQKANAFTTLGATFGERLATAFGLKLKQLNTDLNLQVTAMQTSLNSLRSPTVTSGTSQSATVQRRVSNGISGPVAFSALSEENSGSGATARSFVNPLASIDTTAALNNLATGSSPARTISNTVTNVVNHVNNSRDNHANLVQNIYSDSQNYNSFSRIKGALRG